MGTLVEGKPLPAQNSTATQEGSLMPFPRRFLSSRLFTCVVLTLNSSWLFLMGILVKVK